MSHGFFATVFYIPFYNAFVFIVNLLPGHTAWIGVVLLTLLIRFVLFPLSKKSIRTQILMKKIEPEVQKIKDTVKDTQQQSLQTLALYKEKGVNPFAGLLLVLIQLPILIGLYRVFRSGLPHIDGSILYPFIHAAEPVSMHFFGTDLESKVLRIVFAIIAVVTQFIQINLSLPKSVKKAGPSSFQQDLAHSMNMQMRYIFPLIMFPIAYISAVISLYLITTNLFMTGQELLVKRKMEREMN
jgi:YidC/Oxa1 family membrane protein insertase